MRNVLFTKKAFEDYTFWQEQDRKTLKKVNALIIDIMRNGPEFGLGKPEKLRELQGYWSRRIDDKNRIVYSADDNIVTIIACRTHYGDH